MPDTKWNHFKVIGISHHLASVEMREKFNLSSEDIRIIHQHLASYTNGGFVLSTCNRTEIYCIANNDEPLVTSWAKLVQVEVEELENYLYRHTGKDAIEYLFRVGTGLDSQILGDFQIIGQIKTAYKQAIEFGCENAKITRVIDVLLKTSKRVKNETDLSSGVASMAYASIQHLQQIFDNLMHVTGFVYGAGKMGTAVVRKLAELMRSEDVLLANRTEQRAEALASKYSIQNKSQTPLADLVAQADFLISTPSTEKPIFTTELLQTVDLTGKVFIDLSMPRSIDPEIASINGVTLINLDYLQDLQNETFEIRKKSIPLAEEIVRQELSDLYTWMKNREITPTIHALKEKLHSIKENEMKRLSKENSQLEYAQIESIAEALINKVATQCIKHVKKHNGNSINTIHEIFEIEQKG